MKQSKQIKHKIAEEMHAEWRKFTPSQQLQKLDERLGKNIGAIKQRERLQALIAEDKDTPGASGPPIDEEA